MSIFWKHKMAYLRSCWTTARWQLTCGHIPLVQVIRNWLPALWKTKASYDSECRLADTIIAEVIAEEKAELARKYPNLSTTEDPFEEDA